MSIDTRFAQAARTLAGTMFANLRFVAQTGSTNDDAAQMLGNPTARGCTLVANYQTAGVGRKGRAWVAPPGASLLFTTILPNALQTSQLWIVPFWTALAVRSALQTHGIQVDLQWPNDLLIGNAKVAGILCISRITGQTAWAGCGVGLNVARVDDPGLDEVVPAPAFISDVANISREALLVSILQTFAATLSWLDNPQQISRRWELAAGLPGVRYRLLVDGESSPIDAVAQRLEAGGALGVETNGRWCQIAMADARVLRE